MAEIRLGNLYAGIPAEIPAEITETLAQGDDVRIERIISRGQHSEPGFWYEQEQNEWVLLLKGEAELRFEENDLSVRLTQGSYVDIPAHARHRVEWTEPDGETLWLAVFY